MSYTRRRQGSVDDAHEIGARVRMTYARSARECAFLRPFDYRRARRYDVHRDSDEQAEIIVSSRLAVEVSGSVCVKGFGY